MKLICVNNKDIRKTTNDGEPMKCTANELVEGQIYTTTTKPFINEMGFKCYYIVGYGTRLFCRFAEALDDKEESEETAEKKTDKKKELADAIADAISGISIISVSADSSILLK